MKNAAIDLYWKIWSYCFSWRRYVKDAYLSVNTSKILYLGISHVLAQLTLSVMQYIQYMFVASSWTKAVASWQQPLSWPFLLYISKGSSYRIEHEAVAIKINFIYIFQTSSISFFRRKIYLHWHCSNFWWITTQLSTVYLQ